MLRWPHSVVFVLALVAGGCRRPPPHRVVPPAPYTALSDTELSVRPDVLGLLTFREASAATSEATARGFGRVVFAPSGSYAVRPSVAGFVERVNVTLGQVVKPGQSLATIRSSEVARLRADLARLDATLATEEDASTRLTRLIAEGAASPRELVESKGRLEAARAERSGVRDALAAVGALSGQGERFELRATAAGYVLVRNVSPGERIAADSADPAFLVGDPKRLLVRGSFPERDIALLREGAACRYQLPSLGSVEMEGTLANVVRAVDAKTHTTEALCIPNADDPRLAADMTAKMDASVASRNAVTIPRSAVLLRRDDNVVFVRSGTDRLQRRTVHLGSVIGSDVQIVSGVSAGESVVEKNAVLLDGELDRVL